MPFLFHFFILLALPNVCVFINVVSRGTSGVEKRSSNGLLGSHRVLHWSWFIHLETQVVTVKALPRAEEVSSEILVYREDVRTRPGKKW